MEVNEDLLKKYKEDLDNFNDWIFKETCLPRNIDSTMLLRFLNVCEFDQTKARELIKTNFEFRAKHPQIFSNRDIFSDEIQNVIRSIQIYPLLNWTEENYRITMARWVDENPVKFDIVNTIKWLFVISDVEFIFSNKIADNEIAVIDFKGFTWSHFLKVAGNLSTLKVFLRYVQEAVPYRIVQNHYVNCSPIVSKLMVLLKPFIKNELYEAMHFHTSGYETLYKFIPKEILPVEYGGTCGTADEIHSKSVENVRMHNDFIKDERNFKIIE